MPINENIDTTDLEPIEPRTVTMAPPLDQPQKSPFYRGQVPTTAIVNADAIRNFTTVGIPSYRIVPPQPLNLAGSAINATAAATTRPVLTQPTPAPAIVQTLTTIPTGYQFTFRQVLLPLSSTTAINSYKVYRNTVNVSASAQAIQSIPHHPESTGVPVVVQDSQPNGVTMFYWVSAVSVVGVESSLTPAQASAVASNAGFNSNSQVASSFHGQPVSTSWAPTSSTVLSNTGLSLTIVISSNVNQFAAGTIPLNSGSVTPASFGTWAVFADDPTFAGGPVIYSVSANLQNQVLNEGRMCLGVITTVNSGSSTGGGTSGGTTGASAAGGRGLILL
jgi:hypothetical protein